MSHDQSISSTPNSMPFYFKAMFTKGTENVSAAQKVWMETAERTNRDWVALFEAEAKLGSDFVRKAEGLRYRADLSARDE
jgi:hypothetical protein